MKSSYNPLEVSFARGGVSRTLLFPLKRTGKKRLLNPSVRGKDFGREALLGMSRPKIVKTVIVVRQGEHVSGVMWPCPNAQHAMSHQRALPALRMSHAIPLRPVQEQTKAPQLPGKAQKNDSSNKSRKDPEKHVFLLREEIIRSPHRNTTQKEVKRIWLLELPLRD